MSPEEFAEIMKRIASQSDEEERHKIADEFICDLLVSLGYEEGVSIFVEMHKWYS